MLVQLSHAGRSYEADLRSGLDISIPIDFEQAGPTCFYAATPSVKPVIAGDFVGDTQQGGLVNFKTITINPHGNGTHTECVGHIATAIVQVHEVLTRSHYIGEVVSIYPTTQDDGDRVITVDQIAEAVTDPCEALIIRTLPNSPDKLRRDYSGTNPPYISHQALRYLRHLGMRHLLVDLPSVDREQDEGKLAGHKAWWDYPATLDLERTITELVYVADTIPDGTYLVDIQIISLKLDASPSKIMLFPVRQIVH